jgi:hypothetical protein
MAVPQFPAATCSSAPRTECRMGQLQTPTATAARMCLGHAPIGAAPSQQPARHMAVRYLGALAKDAMQNSTCAARTTTCGLNGRRATLCGANAGSGMVTTSAAAEPGAFGIVRLCVALTAAVQAA